MFFCSFSLFFFPFLNIWFGEDEGGKEISRAVLSQSPIQLDIYFLIHTFSFSLSSFFFILPSSPRQYFFLPENCLYSHHHIYNLSHLGDPICFHRIGSYAVGGHCTYCPHCLFCTSTTGCHFHNRETLQPLLYSSVQPAC